MSDNNPAQYGIKETTEGIIGMSGFAQFGLVCYKSLKDGFQITDIKPILEEIKDEYSDVMDAIEGADSIPDELKDLDNNEIMELFAVFVDQYKEFVAVLNDKA